MFVWDFSGFSGFHPHSKNMHDDTSSWEKEICDLDGTCLVKLINAATEQKAFFPQQSCFKLTADTTHCFSCSPTRKGKTENYNNLAFSVKCCVKHYLIIQQFEVLMKPKTYGSSQVSQNREMREISRISNWSTGHFKTSLNIFKYL